MHFYLEDRRVIANDCKDVLLPNIRILARDISYDVTDLNIFLYDRSTIKAKVERRLVDIRNLNAEISLNGIWRISIVNTVDSNCLIENQNSVCREFESRLLNWTTVESLVSAGHPRDGKKMSIARVEALTGM